MLENYRHFQNVKIFSTKNRKHFDKNRICRRRARVKTIERIKKKSVS